MHIEYRHERLATLDPDETIDHLNRWGEQGWRIFQLDTAPDGLQVWMSRELPISGAGLARRRVSTRETAAAAVSAPGRADGGEVA